MFYRGMWGGRIVSGEGYEGSIYRIKRELKSFTTNPEKNIGATSSTVDCSSSSKRVVYYGLNKLKPHLFPTLAS